MLPIQVSTKINVNSKFGFKLALTLMHYTLCPLQFVNLELEWNIIEVKGDFLP